MAHVIADRVKESTVTTGTGALTLAGAATAYRAFSAVCSVADTVYYAIEAVDANGVATGDWEVGLGTYSSANTLTRTTPSASSNAGSAVNFAAGTKNVWLDVTAQQVAGVNAGTLTGSTAIVGGAVSGTTILATADGTGAAVRFGRSANPNTGLFFPGGNQVALSANGTSVFSASGALASLLVITSIGGGSDTGVWRNAAGVLEVNNATSGTFRDLLVRNTITAGAAQTAAAGRIAWGGTTQATVGAAGAATALPAQPTGYIIINVAGTDMVIPYYAKA